MTITAERSGSEGGTKGAGAPLDLHEGIEAEVRAGCPRWPAEMRLRSTLGQLVPGRCRAVNKCDYCARLAAVETAEVLALDAVQNCAPEVWTVLTTATATMDIKRFRQARQNVRRAVKRRWEGATAATMIEFQTGTGRNSGGERRPHWNDMWKGIPAADADELHEVTAEAWCRDVDAQPAGQFAGEISQMGGLMRYLALHFQKEDQAPPEGWVGHRFRAMKGYLDRPMAQAREEARQSLRFKRELWRAHNAGLTGLEAEEEAHRALYEANELGWELVRLQPMPTDWSADGLPVSWVTEAFVVN